jgi:hypothetical protein
MTAINDVKPGMERAPLDRSGNLFWARKPYGMLISHGRSQFNQVRFQTAGLVA